MSEEKNNVIDIEIDDKKDQPKKEKSESPSPETVEPSTADQIENMDMNDGETGGPRAADYIDQLLRVQAELQNYKRRTEQRMEQWRENAARELVIKLLPVVDDFDILFEHHPNEDESISVKGVAMIYHKFMAALKDLGLAQIEAAGQMFDPNIHEAVMAEESDDAKEGQVLKVWQRGFTFKDSLIRPAKVITAKALQSDKENGQ